MGLLSFNREGNAAVVYYIAVYLFMNLALFYVVMLLSRRGENVTINDLSGLARRSPLLALTLAVAAFSWQGFRRPAVLPASSSFCDRIQGGLSRHRDHRGRQHRDLHLLLPQPRQDQLFPRGGGAAALSSGLP